MGDYLMPHRTPENRSFLTAFTRALLMYGIPLAAWQYYRGRARLDEQTELIMAVTSAPLYALVFTVLMRAYQKRSKR